MMTTRKLLATLSVMLVLVRSAVLMRKEAYRLFPVWYVLFVLGAFLLLRGIRRYLASDWSLRPGSRGGIAWYQDLGLGVMLATGAIVWCAYYVEHKKRKAPGGGEVGGSGAVTEASEDSETRSRPGPETAARRGW